ncbi:hypothetical protein [Nitrosospira sp. NpAV]|nr:hypothetical protein [Nitrosospira sp. NpAV]
MPGFNVFAACFETMVHGCFQTDLVALSAGINTRLHVIGIHMAFLD